MRLLVPTDFSDPADRALEAAVHVARTLGAEVLLVHVISEPPLFAPGLGGVQVDRIHAAQERRADEQLRPRLEGLEAAGLRARGLVAAGRPAPEIVRAAEAHRVDLIVMGTHGRGTAGRFFLGSVTNQVIRTAPCPVMTLRAPVRQ